MSFYDPEKNHNFILSPREISFINKNIQKENKRIRKYNETHLIPTGEEVLEEDEYISLSCHHPDFPFYSHINDIYCLKKVYSPIDIRVYNIQNKTDFTPLNNDYGRPHRKTIKEDFIDSLYKKRYDDNGKLDIKYLFSDFKPIPKYKPIVSIPSN